MATEKRLIEELHELAERTPPICQYDKPESAEIFGEKIMVYCKPFEQFQELLRRAADALSVDAVEVVHGRCVYVRDDEFADHWECSVCRKYIPWEHHRDWNYCPNCGAKMDGDGNG